MFIRSQATLQIKHQVATYPEIWSVGQTDHCVNIEVRDFYTTFDLCLSIFFQVLKAKLSQLMELQNQVRSKKTSTRASILPWQKRPSLPLRIVMAIDHLFFWFVKMSSVWTLEQSPLDNFMSSPQKFFLARTRCIFHPHQLVASQFAQPLFLFCLLVRKGHRVEAIPTESNRTLFSFFSVSPAFEIWIMSVLSERNGWMTRRFLLSWRSSGESYFVRYQELLIGRMESVRHFIFQGWMFDTFSSRAAVGSDIFSRTVRKWWTVNKKNQI